MADFRFEVRWLPLGWAVVDRDQPLPRLHGSTPQMRLRIGLPPRDGGERADASVAPILCRDRSEALETAARLNEKEKLDGEGTVSGVRPAGVA